MPSTPNHTLNKAPKNLKHTLKESLNKSSYRWVVLIPDADSTPIPTWKLRWLNASSSSNLQHLAIPNSSDFKPINETSSKRTLQPNSLKGHFTNPQPKRHFQSRQPKLSSTPRPQSFSQPGSHAARRRQRPKGQAVAVMALEGVNAPLKS